jgi:hypothetical protein
MINKMLILKLKVFNIFSNQYLIMILISESIMCGDFVAINSPSLYNKWNSLLKVLFYNPPLKDYNH